MTATDATAGPTAGVPTTDVPTTEVATLRSTVYAASTAGSDGAGTRGDPVVPRPRQPTTPAADPVQTRDPVLTTDPVTAGYRTQETNSGPPDYRGRRRRGGAIGIRLAVAVLVVVAFAGAALVTGSWPLSRPAASGSTGRAQPPAPPRGLDTDTVNDGQAGPVGVLVSASAKPSASASAKPSASASSAKPPSPTPAPTPTPSPTNIHGVARPFEAESSVNDPTCTTQTTAGSATVVTSIGYGCSLTYKKINLPAAASYTVTFYYTAPGAARTMNIRVNGGAPSAVNAPGTVDGNTIASIAIPLTLVAGNNTIMISNDSGSAWAPRSDRITVK